ncbi:MAG: hypothetical protein IKL42_01350 [Clostridia bacterium]|nr:hypothetical protein [Clostridia bacterium]
MSDDIGKAVEVLQQMLQDEGARENLENIVGQVMGQASEEENSELPASLDNLNLGALLSSVSAQDDQRVVFLKALKPYLNVRRQERIGNAISIMKFVNLSSSLGLMDMLKPSGVEHHKV